MKTTKDKIYLLSPTWIQNCLISIYGISLYRKRYTGNFKSILEQVSSANRYLSKDIEEVKAERLRNIISYAQKEIPYYKKIFSEYSITPSDIVTESDLTKLPILEKTELQKNPNTFTPLRERKYITQSTSGSTGTPLSIKVNEDCYKMAMALLVDHEQSHGINFGERRATFAGRMIKDINNNQPPFSRVNISENQRIFSSYHINNENFKHYNRELNKFSPLEIIGYPSAICALAQQYRTHRSKPDFQLKAVITNSESLLSWQRDIIEDVFNCKVYDYYGTAEYVFFAGQCSSLSYHINPLFGIIETVDCENQPIYESSGDVICTTLTNYAMPLIRYRVGDKATLSQKPCACGNNSPHLTSIDGRKDDVITTTDGRKVGRIDHIFKGLNGIKEAQVIQKSLTKCIIKIVPTDSKENIDLTLLEENMKSRTSKNIETSFIFVEKIERSANGKFKSVISEIEK